MRLIDADALKERFHEELSLDYADIDAYGAGFQDGILTVDSVSTIEAEPVVHAHWEYDINSRANTKWWHCSKCAQMVSSSSIKYKPFEKYCPSCGAKMDEVQDD